MCVQRVLCDTDGWPIVVENVARHNGSNPYVFAVYIYMFYGYKYK